MNLARVFSELRRRRVFRVAGVYLVAAWALLQVSTTIAPLLSLPAWAPRLVLFLLIVGFPVALVLAWAYDITPEGLQRTDSQATPAPAAARVRGGHRVAYLTAAVVILLIGVGAYARWGGRDAPAGAATVVAAAATDAITSVAVLPCENLSGNKENEYFSDGIAEEILDALAQVPGLRVPAWTSSVQLKSKAVPVPDAARQLRVGAILECSIQRQGNSARIDVRLAKGANGYLIWRQSYERELKDAFAVEDEISHAIADTLQVRLAGAAPSVARAGTTNPQAHDLYLLGLAQWHRRGRAAVRNAAEYFQRAIVADPRFARAHAGLALAYVVFGVYGAGPDAEYLPRAAEAARAAVALDSMLPEAHVALGNVYLRFDLDWPASEREFRRAIRLNPNDATAHEWFALLLADQGRAADAVAESDSALRLEPRSIAATNIRVEIFYDLHRFDEAEAEYRRVERMDSSVSVGLLPFVYLCERKYGPAAAELARFARISGRLDPADVPIVVQGLANPARAPTAKAVLDRWAALPTAPFYLTNLAGLYAALGNRASALDILDRAYRERGGGLDNVGIDPFLDPLRSEPRFQALVRKLGLAR